MTHEDLAWTRNSEPELPAPRRRVSYRETLVLVVLAVIIVRGLVALVVS
jgi:hypothetical protein